MSNPTPIETYKEAADPIDLFELVARAHSDRLIDLGFEGASFKADIRERVSEQVAALTTAAQALVLTELQALASSDNWRVLLEDRIKHYQGGTK